MTSNLSKEEIRYAKLSILETNLKYEYPDEKYAVSQHQGVSPDDIP